LFKFKLFKEKKPHNLFRSDLGILVFENTSEVIAAQKILLGNDWEIRVMGPPPEIQTGCDLVIEFPLIQELNIIRLLEKIGIPPIETVPVTSPLLQPVDLFQIKDFGEFLMIRAANMKITVEKSTRLIVNVSGGGCPDVPYLAFMLVGKTMAQAPNPLDIGHTLCGYALGLAFKEMQKKCSQW
jgi:Putative Se/S carrier protein-like